LLALKNSSVSASTFLKRASAYEGLKQYEKAFSDIRNAISLDPTNPDALKSAQRLLSIQQQQNTTRSSPRDLLAIICKNNGHGIELDPEKREAIERLENLSRDESIARTLAHEGALPLISEIIFKSIESKPISSISDESSSSLIHFIKIVKNLIRNKESALTALNTWCKSNTNKLLETENEILITYVIEVLGLFMMNALINTSNDPWTKFPAFEKIPRLPEIAKSAEPGPKITEILDGEEEETEKNEEEEETDIVFNKNDIEGSTISNTSPLYLLFEKRGIDFKLYQQLCINMNTLSTLFDSKYSEKIRVASASIITKLLKSPIISGILISSPTAFTTILSCSDDAHDRIQRLVTVILSKIFDKFEQEALDDISKAVKKIVTTWLDSDDSRLRSKGLIALALLFSARSDVGSKVLMSDGILSSIMEIVDVEPEQVQIQTVEISSAASSDKECRTMIAATCAEYLTKLLDAKNPKLRALAALALTKIMFVDPKNPVATVDAAKEQLKARSEVDDRMADIFITLLADSKNVDTEITASAIEALAFLSIRPAIKETICGSPAFLKTLIDLAKTTDMTIQFGIITIFHNCCAYKQKLTEEEEQLKKLQAFAGEAAAALADDVRDKDEAVQKRGEIIVKSGGVASLITFMKNASTKGKELIATIFKHLSTDPRLRGMIVQQGAIPVLLSIALSSDVGLEGKLSAAHALAKIAVTTDPNVAFVPPRAANMITPLKLLLNAESELKQFEGLLALTNLASMGDRDVFNRIVSSGAIKSIEFLQLSDNPRIQCAATEALCNLMYFPDIYKSYTESSSTSRIKIFLALSDVEDFETRRAASGALAILSTSSNVCEYILNEKIGWEVVSGLISKKEENDEILRRGVEIFKNMMEYGSSKVKDEAIKLGGENLLKRLIGRGNGIGETAQEAISCMKSTNRS